MLRYDNSRKYQNVKEDKKKTIQRGEKVGETRKVLRKESQVKIAILQNKASKLPPPIFYSGLFFLGKS